MVVASGWLGFPGATEAETAAAEAHLGVTLPPSYRAFLRVSNGWHRPGGPASPKKNRLRCSSGSTSNAGAQLQRA